MIVYEDLTRERVEEIARDLDCGIRSRNIEHAYSRTADIVTISQGVCWDYPVEGQTMADYLQVADACLYKVKEQCRGGIVLGAFRVV